MSVKRLTYGASGVSVKRGDDLVDMIAPLAKKTRRPEVVASIGGFAALSRIPKKYKKPLLVLSTDGVGTKVKLASQLNRFNTVGIDLVAMSVNDILTVGAEPLLFLDYFATGKLNLKQGKQIIAGVARGCKLARCALVGGETAEMPQVYRGDDFDLAGFCVGVVEESKVIDGRKVRAGDVLLGIPSAGIHSNGYSLVRAVLKRSSTSLRSIGKAILTPTRIYVPEILRLLGKVDVHAMSHVTGGGLEGNVPRAFPHGLSARIDKTSWKIPKIFLWLQKAGKISEREMFKTFNMGIGFVVVVSKLDVLKAKRMLPGAVMIGEVVKLSGEPRVLFN